MVFSALGLLLIGAPQTSILAVDKWVVGVRAQGKWRPVTHAFATNRAPVTLRSFGIGKVANGTLKSGFAGEEVSGGSYLSSESAGLVGWVHVSGMTPRIPRRVTLLPTSSAVYRNAVRIFLAGQGLRDSTVRLSKVARMDLDGDGTDEVIIEANSRGDLDRVSNSDTGKSDYSLVLLRYVAKGGSRAMPLEFISRRRGETLELKQLRGIADLDGDGRMEIVTTGKGYEWNNAQLWSFRSGRLVKLLENGEGV